jgi:hypothetical protein
VAGRSTVFIPAAFIPAAGGRTREDREVGDRGSDSVAVTAGNQDRGQRQGSEPAASQPADDETGERGRLSDSIVGLFDRLREAAETHDGD